MDNNDDAKRRWRGRETALGGLLVLLGILVLAGQAVDVEVGQVGWPFFVLVPGLGLLGLGLATPGRLGEVVAMVGGVVSVNGLVLGVQNATDRFDTWAYARFGPGRQLAVTMTFQGLTQAQATRTWAPLLDWVTARPADYTLADPQVLALPAQEFWNAEALDQVPGLIVRDDRPGAPEGQFYYAVDAAQVGQVLHGYGSTWLSRRLLEPHRRPALVQALVRASQLRPVALHTNKGLAGAPAKVLDRTRDTAMNPAVLDAFALAIASANEPPAYPGIPGHEPDLAQGRADARVVAAAMAPLQALADRPGSYLSETDYFQHDWQAAFWGDHYARLTRVKDRYDPDGLFSVHHGVGTET